MTYALTPTYDTSHLTIENMMSHMRDLPEMSKETIRILTIVQKNLPGQTVHTEFSKAKILQKITNFTRSSEKFHHLEAHRGEDQCKAVARGVLNIGCAVGAGFAIDLIPNSFGAGVAAGMLIAGYAATGFNNFIRANPESATAGPGDGNVIEACAGFVFGPYFAFNEAINRIPERIVTAQEAMILNRGNIVSDFGGLVALGRLENSNPLRDALNSKISGLRAKIDAFTKSELYLDPSSLETSQTTRDLLSGAASKAKETRQQLGLNLIAYNTALTELDGLIQHLRQRILTSNLPEVIALNIDSELLARESLEVEQVPVVVAEPVDNR